MINFKNTLQKGSFRRIIFKEGDIWYAVALELNIVVSASDSRVAMFELFEAVDGYIDSVKKSNSRPFALNQVPEKDYEDMWSDLNSGELVKSPFTVFDFGVTSI
jgi:accessory colonization factor AcfC